MKKQSSIPKIIISSPEEEIPVPQFTGGRQDDRHMRISFQEFEPKQQNNISVITRTGIPVSSKTEFASLGSSNHFTSTHNVQTRLTSKSKLGTVTHVRSDDLSSKSSNSDDENATLERVKKKLFKSWCWKDKRLKIHRSFVDMLSKGLFITSIMQVMIVLWISTLMPQTFSGNLVTKKGLYEDFPPHYLLVCTSILGLLSTAAIKTMLHFGMLGTKLISVLVTIGSTAIFSFLAFVYHFISNIAYANEIEIFMAEELIAHRENSAFWVNTQNYFHCCGISSPSSWNLFVPSDDKGRTYPLSCCNPKLSVSLCEQRPHANEVFTTGCLDYELDLIRGGGFSVNLLESLHFFLSLFSTVMTLKIHRRYLLLKTKESLRASDSGSTQDFPLHKCHVEKLRRCSVDLPQRVRNKNSIIFENQIKRSSTV